MALLRTAVYSILASTLATVAARRILSISQPPENERGANSPSVVVVVPVIAGNNHNRIGWVKEDHHHYHSLFGRTRR